MKTFRLTLGLSILLIVGGFICPPMGVIDGNVLTAVGLLLAFAILAQLPLLIEAASAGKRIRLQKGISRLRSRLSIHPLVRRDVACNVSVRIINGYVGDVARYVSTGWWHRERLERNVSDVGSPLFFSLHEL